MPHFTPYQKHEILVHLQSRRDDQTIDDIAHMHNIIGGRRTLLNWRAKWDGTPASLTRTSGSGRPRLLSRAQVNNLIRTPIRNKNRAHHNIHYTQLLPSVRQKSHTEIALRTLQNCSSQRRHSCHLHEQAP